MGIGKETDTSEEPCSSDGQLANLQENRPLVGRSPEEAASIMLYAQSRTVNIIIKNLSFKVGFTLTPVISKGLGEVEGKEEEH